MSGILHTVALLSFLAAPAWAAGPVVFVDPKLKAVVEHELWTSDPTADDMLGLTSLPAESQGITDLTGLEYALNLEKLWIRWNKISDLSPLAGLTKLVFIDAHANNRISDVSPLAGLVNLQTLILRYTEVSDISSLSGLIHLEHVHLEYDLIADVSALSGMSSLEEISLQYNQISDISPLTSLTNLRSLDLRGNPLDEDACSTCIPQIRANNPGVDILHNPCSLHHVTLSSTAGGDIVEPGEGEFAYANGEIVHVRAVASPGFRFAGFSGTFGGIQNPMFLCVEQDHQISADFVSALNMIHVDDDARNDPRPGDSTGSDPAEDGTAAHPFDGIQKAIRLVAPGSTILVHPGTYRESVDFLGKPIELVGIDVNSPLAPYPVLQGNGADPVVRFTGGEDSNSVLRGFVIAGGKARSGAGIFCSGSSPTIANCLIEGNRAADPAGVAVYCGSGRPVFINCTIADNTGGDDGAGISSVSSSITLANSIVWGNRPRDILVTGAGQPSIRYSGVAGDIGGTGNTDADPLFACAGYWADRSRPAVVVTPDYYDAVWIAGDYHLRSQAGRWDPATAAWVQDAVTSPCIDAGDPASPVGDEPAPNGAITNMGAYGGTAQAGKSLTNGFTSEK